MVSAVARVRDPEVRSLLVSWVADIEDGLREQPTREEILACAAALEGGRVHA